MADSSPWQHLLVHLCPSIQLHFDLMSQHGISIQLRQIETLDFPKTLPKALQNQALTVLTSNFGLVSLVH